MVFKSFKWYLELKNHVAIFSIWSHSDLAAILRTAPFISPLITVSSRAIIVVCGYMCYETMISNKKLNSPAFISAMFKDYFRIINIDTLFGSQINELYK